jgi:DegV family protein with EDD domain
MVSRDWRSSSSRAGSSTIPSSSASSSARSRGFGVVTDSTADLPPEWRDRYGIDVVPLKVHFGGETFRDRVDLTDEQFFEKLGKASQLPTTSAPAPGEFAQVFERLSKECSGCVCIHIGAQLSGTAEAARVGAESLPGFDVRVLDSRSVSMTIAFLCRVAAESRSLDEAVSAVEERVPRQRVVALLDTLRYVEMGGRVSRAQAMIGSMLDLKPILGLAGSDGKISAIDRVRTRSRAVPRMLDVMRADLPLESLAVMHAQAPEEAERIRAEVQNELPDLKVETGQIGCVLGTHTGPRALGLTYVTRA